MWTAYKCRAYPTSEQASVLNRTFGCVRVVWNRTLAWRDARYRGEQVRTNFTQANAYLTAMKASEDLGWLNEVSSVPLQQVIRHQQVPGHPIRGGFGPQHRDAVVDDLTHQNRGLEGRPSGREETPLPPFNNVLSKARSLLKLIHVDGI